MKSSTIPVFCGLSLAAMSAAGLSHWWTVHQLVADLDSMAQIAEPNQQPTPSSAPATQFKIPKPAPLMQVAPASPAALVESGAAQKEFYEALLAEMKKLRTENRDLLDQVAETNRDLMKLEFRVDTHSESFRPLPVSEERIETTSGDDSGVLPPRAQPVALPTRE